MIRPFPAFSTHWTRLQRPLLALAVLAGIVICLTPNSNPDLPMHLATGRVIATSRAIPRAEFFSWTRQGRPWIDYEWGAELVFYGVESAGGPVGLWLFKAAAFAALMIPFILLLRLWKLPDAWTSAALLPFMLSFVPFLNLRPEIFSFLLTGVQLLLLEAGRVAPGGLPAGEERNIRRRLSTAAGGRGPVTGPAPLLVAIQFIMYAAWSNLHPGYPMGLVLCACYCAGQFWERKNGPLFLALAAAALLGSLVNPYGIQLYSTFLKHGGENAVLRANVVEWQLPNPGNLYQTPYWILFLFSACMLFVSRLQGRALPRAHELVIAAFGLASLTAYRQNAYIGLTAFPLALRACFELRPLWETYRYRYYVLAAFFLLLANMGATVLRVEGLFRRIGGRYDATAACDFLKKNRDELSRLRLFNSWYWGSYLDYALYPDYRVFMDGRFGGIFTDYLPLIKQAASAPGPWRAFLDDQRVELVLLDRRRPVFSYIQPPRGAMRPLDVFYMPRERWALIYWDDHAWIWVRRSAADKKWLSRHEFHWIHPGDTAFLRIQIKNGAAPLPAVRSEVWRYFREIGDPWEKSRWVDDLKRIEANQPRRR